MSTLLCNTGFQDYITVKLNVPMENVSRRRKPFLKILIAALIIFLGLFIAAVLTAPAMERRLKEEMVQALKERFQSEVELKKLEVSVYPVLRAHGTGLKLWKRGMSKDVPPLISVENFTLNSSFSDIFGDVKRINRAKLTGFVIQIPPKNKEKNGEPVPKPAERAVKPSGPKKPRKIPRFVIKELNADGTLLKILPSRPDKDPLIFELYKLNLHSVGIDRPMKFHAVLKNAKPPGLIQTNGNFGPWFAPDPGQTRVSGEYDFRNANLEVFNGIKGILASTGKYAGVLERLDVNGTTDTPDFGLQRVGSKVPLKTDFHAIVDGTKGDTLLKPVVAFLGKTKIVCDGGVIGKKGIKGKSVLLDVQIKNGRIQDLLTLAVPTKPLMTGMIDFQAKFNLPPGDVDVVEKLDLEGTFEIARAVFRSFAVQKKIEELSKKSRGQVDEEKTPEDERIASNMKGKFVMRGGSIRFSELSFSVPGAVVALAGSYGLRNESIDFKGELRMQATLSQTQKGFKSVLLKIVDPFFKKKGYGAVVPIKITGSVKEPNFGLNL